MAESQQNKDVKVVTFEKGLFMDGQRSVQPDGTYPYALNVVNRDQYQTSFKSNEASTLELKEYPALAGSALIKDQNREVLITKSGEIHVFDYDKEESKLLGSFEDFGCSMEVADCEWINIQATSQGCDTYIHWSSNYTYYWVNLTEWENEKRKAALVEKLKGDCRDCNATCDYFLVFRPKCAPTISTYGQQTGGSLSAGAYVYVVRLVNSDGSVTNWSTPSEPVYIGSENNIPGEDANGRVSVEFCGLDCNYNQIEVAIVYYDGSQITATVAPPEFFSKDSYTYTHTITKGDPITISELLLKGQINLSGTDLLAHDGYMYYFGIRPTRDYNVQKIASNVQVEWVAEKYTLEDAKKYQIQTVPYGESLAFGIVLNNDDGTHTFTGHIPCSNGGTSSSTSGEGAAAAVSEPEPQTEGIEDVDATGNNNTASTSKSSGAITMSQEPEYKRERKSKPNTVGNLQRDDQLVDVLKQLVDSYNTDINDLVSIVRPVCACPDPEPCCPDCEADELNKFCNVCGGHKDADIIAKNIEQAEDIAAKWGSILDDYIGTEQKKDLVREFKPTTIKEVAQDIISAVKNRERIEIKGRKFNVTKDSSYNTGSAAPANISKNLDNSPTYPGGSIVASGKTECKEESRLYPCTTDCEGNFIYGDLAGTPIKHHKFPDETQVEYFESQAVGVPSEATPDADEYKDVYIVALGARFSNININKEEYEKVTGKKLCPNNPYTIVQIKINDSNKTILHKGLIHSNYISENKGKQYDFQRHAVNSRVQVNRYIDTGAENDERRDNNATPSNTVCMYSLDQAVLQQFIGNATKLKVVTRLSGIGYRHYLYREGKKASNLTFGKRIDKKGTVSATNLSNKIPITREFDVSFAKYIDADVTEAPGSGGVRALINKKGQPTLWIGLTSTYQLIDDSFLGDVLNHAAPIERAQAEYAVLYRELADQYGSLEAANYIPILEACNAGTSISGLFGDRFIAPYSYVRTSWVSDKVGNSFPIGNMVPGKSDRSICDGPEDTVNNLVGKYFWTELPKDNDPADPKNWAGTYTTTISKTWGQSRGRSADSHYYYPGTLTHMNTFVGESEANPFMLELSDDIKKQRYPYIKPLYSLNAVDAPWEEAYQSQWGAEIEQPSPAELMIKRLGMSFVNLLMPALGLSDLFSADGTLDLAGDLASLPIFVALFLLMSKVLFTSDFFDEWLGLPKCLTDDEGGIKWDIKGFFTNFDRYSYVFSQRRDLKNFQAIQQQFNCECETGTTNGIYVSDRQIETSYIDAYKSVRPNNFIVLSQSEGKVTDMFTALNGSLCAHTTDGIWVIKQSTARVPTSGPFDLITGSTNLTPQLLYGGSGEGYAGLKNRNHAIDSAYGRFFVDYESSHVYNFDGRNLIPLEAGVRTFYDNYLRYCSKSECSDEYQGRHITLGIDTSLKRLLITKADDEASWTLSYDLDTKAYVGFHSYIPNKYLYTRDALYAIKDNTLYRHSRFAYEDFGYLNFYGIDYPIVLDAMAEFGGTVNYESHVIRTDAEEITLEYIKQNLNTTFNQIAVWNSRQTAGVHNLIPSTVQDREQDLQLEDEYGNLSLKRVDNEWRVNEFYDYTIDSNEAIIKKTNSCTPFIEPTNYGDTSNRSIQTSEDRVLRDNFLYTRLKATHLSKIKLYIKNMLVVFNKKTR